MSCQSFLPDPRTTLVEPKVLLIGMAFGRFWRILPRFLGIPMAVLCHIDNIYDCGFDVCVRISQRLSSACGITLAEPVVVI